MLLKNECYAIASIKVELTFDDGSTKTRVIGTGDLIDVLYNANGLRKRIEGVVVAVSANGSDPNKWYIIVDASDDFGSQKAKFSPKSILDVEIIRKADTLDVVQTVIGEEGVPYIRIVRGQLQYSKDGYNWRPIHIHPRDIIEPAEGGVCDHGHPTPGPRPFPPHPHHGCEEDGESVTDTSDDTIDDANW